jgi:hypothetical protein
VLGSVYISFPGCNWRVASSILFELQLDSVAMLPLIQTKLRTTLANFAWNLKCKQTLMQESLRPEVFIPDRDIAWLSKANRKLSSAALLQHYPPRG